MYLLINNLMYVLFKILMHVFKYDLKHILMFANVCIEDLITEMEPSLSVYVTIIVRTLAVYGVIGFGNPLLPPF